MIPANELRIGNCVKFYNELVTVLALQDGKISYWLDTWGFPDVNVFEYEDKYEGIPLTPEILESCGFEKNKNIWFYKFKEHFSLEVNEDDFWLQGYNATQHKVEHLHQLQNLYFTLIGIELEVKLNVPA